MSLISLGIADLSGPPRPAGAPPMDEVGTTGTPIFGGGFLRDLGEYNSDFQGGPFSYFRLFEKMRRSDAQVKATLMAVKLPIRCAEWTVLPGEDADSVEKEAADLVKECLLEEIDFDAALQNALLMLDFGVAAHEDCWYVDGNRVRLKKLAARLPMTFYQWITAPDSDDLTYLVQMGYRGQAYVRTEIPVEKLGVFTHEKEGGNYAGVSLCRAMYQNWYTKAALYKIDAISLERNGMGVPTIIMGPNAKAEDRQEALAWIQQLSAHEKLGILLPPEWTFKLEGVTGSTRDAKDSIEHHNLQISVGALVQFMMLGHGGSSGNRALGQTMSDFFYMGLQATANQVARTFNLTTIKRLVDYNFGGRVKRYPKLVPQQILSVKFEVVVDALSKLATAKAVLPDEELENWIRKKMGAPEVDAKTTRQPAPPQQDKPTTTQEAPEPGADPAGKRQAEGPQGKEGVPGSQSKTTASEAPGLKLARAPRGPEKYLALSEIVGALDKGRDDVAGALRAARSRVQAEIVHKLVDAKVRDMHRVSVAPDQKLIDQVEGILRGVADFGAGQVAAERDRQRAGAAPGDAATIRMAERAKRDSVGVYADGVVSEFTNNLTSRATNVALDLKRRQDVGTGDMIRQAEEELDGQSDKWIDSVAGKGANEAFADGREGGYEEHADEISSVIYSALLDINTCEACAAADGQEGATPDDIPDVPNPDCDGGDRCRCVHVFVFADETKEGK